MVRPRFFNLAHQQQQAIVRAAVDEFATHGFHDGSLNRVIEAAGVSKGSLYYYFDGKEDLYTYVTRLEFERLFAGLGPFHAPVHGGPDDFWSGLEGYYVEVMAAFSASPQLGALTRGWLAASGNPALSTAQQEMERVALPWIERTLAAGQDLGAIRADLPSGLLVAVVVGMGQAMDTWLVAEQPDPDTRQRLIHTFVTMIRGALEP
ncbi:TetR/AcrR family transcriptional regulator [Actinomycetospora sp. CA-053990]|uniref:TetR/AcrR family transcriptional regulator n=1 Tax=Actinomycetospora sp. CA-053990 TaxID=3239891 RepID=UPI003D91A268